MTKTLATLLLVIGALGLGLAGLTFEMAKSAVHEIEALIAALIGVCGLGLGGVLLALDAHQVATTTAINRSTQVAITESKLAETRGK